MRSAGTPRDSPEMSEAEKPPLGFKPREFTRVNSIGEGSSPDPNDVRAVLRENLTKANTAGLNDVRPPTPRRSRRRRDYLIALLAGNLVLFLSLLVSPIFAGAGIIIYNVGLAWAVWVVMDDY